VPSYLIRRPPSCAGPGAPSHLGDATSTAAGQHAPLFQRGLSVATGEHRPLIAIDVRLELDLKTLPCGVTVVQWLLPARPFRRPSNLCPLAVKPRLALHALTTHRSRASMRSGHAWAHCLVGRLCPSAGASLAGQPVRVGRASQAGSVLWPGHDRLSMHCACGPRA
jgi:hypothetical protein